MQLTRSAATLLTAHLIARCPRSRDLAGCWTGPCIPVLMSGACAPVNIFCPAVPSRRLQQRRPWAMLRCASGLGLIARLTLQVSGLVAHAAAAHLIGAAALASARAAAASGLRVRRPSRVRWRRCRRGSHGRGAGQSRTGARARMMRMVAPQQPQRSVARSAFASGLGCGTLKTSSFSSAASRLAFGCRKPQQRVRRSPLGNTGCSTRRRNLRTVDRSLPLGASLAVAPAPAQRLVVAGLVAALRGEGRGRCRQRRVVRRRLPVWKSSSRDRCRMSGGWMWVRAEAEAALALGWQ